MMWLAIWGLNDKIRNDMLKYKVIKDFGSARKGDVLVNSVEDPQVFTMDVAMVISKEITIRTDQ